MYNNPYFNGFGGYKEPNQQPIQNIINTQMATSNDMFMARILNENEKVDEIFINHKTAFIDLFNRKLTIKEINGNKQEYEIILPKDEKDLQIEALQNQINELKGVIDNERSTSNDSTNNEISKSNGNAKKLSRK